MLTIPMQRIAFILAQASEVEPADVIAAESESFDEDDADTDEFSADTAAHRMLTETLGRLSPNELYELLALAEFAKDDGSVDTWDSAFRRAQMIAADDAVEQLKHVLVLSDAIEVALERLGYDLPEAPKAGITKKRKAVKLTKKAKPKIMPKKKTKVPPKRKHRR